VEVVDKSVLTRAAVGAVLIGVGLSLMLSASRKLNCEECEEKEAVLDTGIGGFVAIEEVESD
jgi:hypothetical protein